MTYKDIIINICFSILALLFFSALVLSIGTIFYVIFLIIKGGV
jgi:hypothetical protein